MARSVTTFLDGQIPGAKPLPSRNRSCEYWETPMPEEDNAPRESGSETRKNPVRRSFLWISSVALGCCFLGVAFVSLTNQAVNRSSSDNFCGTACHTMTWPAAAYHQSSHYTNNVGVRASCGDCHIPYDSGHATAVEYVKLLLFKADRGGKDIWFEINRSIATKKDCGKASSGAERHFRNLSETAQLHHLPRLPFSRILRRPA